VPHARTDAWTVKGHTLEPEQPPQGTAAPEAAEGTDVAPKHVTEQQLNKAITSRMKSFEERLEKSFGESFTSFSATLRTELAGLMPKPPEAKSEGGKKPGEKPESPELHALQDEVARLKKESEDVRIQRDVERTKLRDASLRQTLTDALASAGIEGVRARHAVGLLVDAEKRVRWSEREDAAVFRRSEHDVVPLDEGLGEWLRSDDAKLYLPPRNAAGSGDRPGGAAPKTPAAAPTRSDVAEGLRRALLGQI
jgi:hypothetical protein